MKRYRLIVYWWNGPSHEYRAAGGEYSFEALHDDDATRLAHVHFEEQINLADQSAIVDEIGRVVWQNEAAHPRPADK
jgi:hypothetical protein